MQQHVAVHLQLNDFLHIRGDRIQLQQVILNLLLNAAEAMETIEVPKELRVSSCRTADGKILVAVRDRGIGIGPHDAGRLFGPFFTTKPGGMGMGLPISRTIVEAHGGRIWADSNADGPGLTVQFELPAEDAEPSQANS